MTEIQPREGIHLPNAREELFQRVEHELQDKVQIYRLGDRFEGLSSELAKIQILDVTQVLGCHYGVKNVFVPIIHHLERDPNSPFKVNPDTAILVEPSTGNGFVAFSEAADRLSYEHIVIMPDGMPESRYKHPQGKEVKIIRTSAEGYATGMPPKLKAMINQNRLRVSNGEKVYISPNHAISSADITVEAMSEVGRQLTSSLNTDIPLRVVLSMGNGASLCSIGEFVKRNSKNANVVATESLAYGGGYDRFASYKGLPSYKQLYGIEPGNEVLMKKFDTYGTNAPLGVKLPLQERAFRGDLIDEYVLFTNDPLLNEFASLDINDENLQNSLNLPNHSKLPQVIFDTYGNSTLANIAVASKYTDNGEEVVAMAYDGRANYS